MWSRSASARLAITSGFLKNSKNHALLQKSEPLHLHRQFAISTNKLRFLSANYDCKSTWEKRLETPLLSKIELDDFFHEMEKKYVTDQFISAIDVDLFLNRVTEEDNLEEMEELTYRLRKSSVTHETLPSTSFALIRAFLDFDRTEDLMRILDDRLNYGIFPDHYTCNLLMDIFLDKKNFKDAARIASLLMLNEDFGPPTTKLFALLSCLKLVDEGIPDSWEPAKEEAPKDPTKKEKKPEEVRVRVLNLRNVFFDDHFDLTKPEHIVGKTLAYLSFDLSEHETLQRSVELLGWALYDKWDKVESSLKKFINNKQNVSSEVVQRVTDLVKERLTLVDSSPDKTLPKPKLRQIPGLNLEPNQVAECFARIKWDEPAKHLSSVKEILSSSKLTLTELSPTSTAHVLLSKSIEANEKIEIENRIKEFKQWEVRRVEELDRQLTRFREEEKLYEIERKKRELREREDTIFFFDNEEKWMMQQPQAPEPEVVDPKKIATAAVKGKIAGKPVDDANYIPPQVHSAHAPQRRKIN